MSVVCVCGLCSYKSIVQYIDAQYEKYLQDESGLNRRNIADGRVHCCFYFINPSGHGSVQYRYVLFIKAGRRYTEGLFVLPVSFFKTILTAALWRKSVRRWVLS